MKRSSAARPTTPHSSGQIEDTAINGVDYALLDAHPGACGAHLATRHPRGRCCPN
jgi:hypothetical protein